MIEDSRRWWRIRFWYWREVVMFTLTAITHPIGFLSYWLDRKNRP
jgi:hypothetical protein